MPRTWYCCNKFTRSLQEHKLWDLEPVCEHDDRLILECAEELLFNSLLFFSEENRDVFERSIDQKSLPSPVKVYWSKLSTILTSLHRFQKIMITCNSSSAPCSSPSYQDAALEHPALHPEQEICELRGFKGRAGIVSFYVVWMSDEIRSEIQTQNKYSRTTETCDILDLHRSSFRHSANCGELCQMVLWGQNHSPSYIENLAKVKDWQTHKHQSS